MKKMVLYGTIEFIQGKAHTVSTLVVSNWNFRFTASTLTGQPCGDQGSPKSQAGSETAACGQPAVGV